MKLSEINVGGFYTFRRRLDGSQPAPFAALVVSKVGVRGSVMVLVSFRDRKNCHWVERLRLTCGNLHEPLKDDTAFDEGVASIRQYLENRGMKVKA